MIDEDLGKLRRSAYSGGYSENLKHGNLLRNTGLMVEAAAAYNSAIKEANSGSQILEGAQNLLSIGYKADTVRHLNTIQPGNENPGKVYIPAKRLLTEALFGDSIDMIREYKPGELKFEKIKYLNTRKQLADLAGFSDTIDLQRAIFETALAEKILNHYLQEVGQNPTSPIIPGIHTGILQVCKNFYQYWQELRPEFIGNAARTMADYSIDRKVQPDPRFPKLTETDTTVEVTNNPEKIGFNQNTLEWEEIGGTKIIRPLPVTGYPVWTTMDPTKQEVERLQREDPTRLALLGQDLRLYTDGIPHKTTEKKANAVQSSVRVGIPERIADEFTSKFWYGNINNRCKVVLYRWSGRGDGPFGVDASVQPGDWVDGVGALRASRKG